MKRCSCALLILAIVALAGCTETGEPPRTDPGPQVVIYFPPTAETGGGPDGGTFVVSDSVDIYAGAIDFDESGRMKPISKLWFMFSRDNSSRVDTVSHVDLLGEGRYIRRPIVESISRDSADIPDSVRPYLVDMPDDWRLYRKRWYTGPEPRSPVGNPINTGNYVQLFAIAIDDAGNAGRSQIPRVRILNLGDDLRPPDPGFTITPTTGEITVEFQFDPSPTHDLLDPDEALRVRWDFGDGDSVGWSEGRSAAEIVTHRYRSPRTYLVRLETKNSYLSDVITMLERPLTVLPEGGEPRPPNPDDFVLVTPGIYSMGPENNRFIIDGQSYPADSLEIPVHLVQIRERFMIEKYEVTNQRYLNYFREARDSGALIYRNRQVIRVSENPDSAFVYLRLPSSKIFFDPDAGDLRIASGWENHPLTGVSWYGAQAYAVHYGLRLPTEAEWEIAARGAHSGYHFPIHPDGQDLPIATSTQRVNYQATFRPTRTSPVGYFDGRPGTIDTRSVFGLYDMAGNVAEWVADWLDWYRNPASPQPEIDPSGPILPQIGMFKVVRGGSHADSRSRVRMTSRAGANPPDESFPTIGFRTAYSVVE